MLNRIRFAQCSTILMLLILVLFGFKIGFAYGGNSSLCNIPITNGLTPYDYFKCFTGNANFRKVNNYIAGSNHIVEVWEKNDPRRTLDINSDPCIHDGDSYVDDTLFWFSENGFTTNYEEGYGHDPKISNIVVSTTSDLLAIVFEQQGGVGFSYGYYSESMGHRYAICIDESYFTFAVRNTIVNQVWIDHDLDLLFRPTNVEAYNRPGEIELRWNLDSDDTGDETSIFRVIKKNGTIVKSEILRHLPRFHWVDESVANCDGDEYLYWVSSASKFDDFTNRGDYPYGAHSHWADPIRVFINSDCSGGQTEPINDNDEEPQYPATYTPTPATQPTLTPTPTVVQCTETGWGAYLYNSNSSCYFVPRGETRELPFSPVRLVLRGDGVNVKLCSTSNGSEPCSEVNNSRDDLSWSSIYGKFRSAKVSDGYTSNCGSQILEFSINLYSEFDYQGSCRVYTPGRYNNLPFSPRSMKFGSEWLSVSLCQNNDGGNPCSEWHDSQTSLRDSSIFGNFHSAVINLEEPVIGNLSVGSISLSADQRTLYFHARNEGEGFATLLVQLIEDPDTGVLRQKQYVYARNDTPTTVEYRVRAETVCFWISIDPENYYGEVDRSDNYDLFCKDGGHERVPADDSWIPEASIIVGDSYVFEPFTQKLRVRPDYGTGWDTTAQLVVIEGHRPDGWLMATPWSTLENVHPFNDAMRVEVINNLITRCNGEGNGCREAQEFNIKEDGTVQKIVHTQLLPTPTVTPTSTPRPTIATRTPIPTSTATKIVKPTATATATSTVVIDPSSTPTTTPTVVAEQSPTPTVTPTISISVPMTNTLFLPLVTR